jgi:hypothetical protein
MICSKCNIPMLIINGEYVVSGDGDPNTPTVIEYVQTLECSKCKRQIPVVHNIDFMQKGGEQNG